MIYLKIQNKLQNNCLQINIKLIFKKLENIINNLDFQFDL